MSLRVANVHLRWPDLRVPYVIYENDFSAGSPERREVDEAIVKMKRTGGVELIERSNERDYVEFRAASSSCSSPVGRQGGAQAIHCNVKSRGFGVGSVMHEICHSLGFYHEHQRPDRDDYFSVDSSHPDYKAVNYAEVDDAVVADDYDFGSIMHYGPNSTVMRLLNGVVVPSGVTVGQRNDLSTGDIQALEEMKSGHYQGSTYDKSGVRVIQVQTVNGVVSIRQGERKRIVVPNYRFWWYSAGSREWTTAPYRTNTIQVFRERNSRNINWACYHDPSSPAPRMFLGNEHDKCSRVSLYVQGRDGRVRIGKGETREIRIVSREFTWWCGRTRERSVAPRGTNLIVATRAPRGRSVTWACYKE